MKSVAKLFSILFLAIVSQITAIAQQETITWALTTDGSVIGGTSVTPSPLVIGNGVGSSGYNPTSGVFSNNWSAASNDYYEYSITTPSNKTFVVSSISFDHSDDGGSGTYNVYYSTDGFVSRTSIGSGLVSSTTINISPLNIQLPVNKKLSFRVVCSNSNSSKNYFNKNFRINGAGAAAGPLPVTLANFTAKQTTDNNVSLAWVTSSESVNKGFSIERQEEGSGKFQSLGFIPSKAEGGNSQTTLAYSFKDVTAKKGTNMYRLVQEDLDGKKTYSEVRVVKLSAQSVSNVYPNPSNGAINISRTNDGKKMNLQVLDQSGRVISQVNNITDVNYRMNISQSGIYSIKMMYPESGEQSIQRIVVQK